MLAHKETICIFVYTPPYMPQFNVGFIASGLLEMELNTLKYP